MKRKDYFFLLIIIISILLVMFITKGINNIYGSKTDWLSQHWALPEYFRNLFYETGKLFPNFAPNLGGGQNIYNFSYYGLLNPIILISYFFPFIKMVDYIIISSILIVIGSAILFYKWLLNNNFNSKVSFLSTFVFVFANFFIFHSHRHMMFINYFPFLILGLMGVDKYFKNNQKWLLILSVFLLIMTSYFYSVGGLIVIFIYGLYKNIDENLKFKTLILRLLKMIGIMMIGILMASMLLMPTIAVIINGRGQVVNDVDLITLLKPQVNDKVLLYSTYSLGFTIVGLVSLIYGFVSKNKKLIMLASLLSLIFFVPIFMYILNGMLYVRPKVLIPFAPLIGILIANFLKKVFEKDISLLPLVIGTLIIGIMNFTNDDWSLAYFLDFLILFLAIGSYYRFRKELLLIIPIIVVALFSAFKANFTEDYVPKEKYKNYFNVLKTKAIKETINQDSTYYRFNNLDTPLSTSNKIYHSNYYQTSLYSSTYNFDYNNFYFDVFKNAIPNRNRVITAQSSNILFQTLMGVKYIGTSGIVPIGYELINDDSNFKIYKNENVFPLGYATKNIMGIKDYNKLKYPYNLESLLKGVVVEDEESNYEFINKMERIKLNYISTIGDNILVNKRNNNNYYFEVLKSDNINLKINNIKEDQILLIKFDVLNNPSCKDGDISITINGIKNVLTCKEWIYHNRNYSFEYVISSNSIIDNLKIKFVKGIYEISNIETFVLDYNEIKDLVLEFDKLEVDMNKTKGDYIYGEIEVSDDGYFVSTIPYDKGFKVFLNKEKVSIEKINQTFLGFPIKKGNYEIIIKYESPLFKEGLLMSGVSFIGYIGLIILDKKKKTN